MQKLSELAVAKMQKKRRNFKKSERRERKTSMKDWPQIARNVNNKKNKNQLKRTIRKKVTLIRNKPRKKTKPKLRDKPELVRSSSNSPNPDFEEVDKQP